MAEQWFYAVNEQKHGPVDLNTLKDLAAASVVTPATLVWREGMPQWAAAGSVEALGLGVFKTSAAPPPLPTNGASPSLMPTAGAIEGDATGGLIPYKNVPALLAYYFGVFSVIPFFPIGIAAFILGLVGLKRARENPAVRGKAHAWIGILAGGFFTILWVILPIIFIS